MHVHVYLSLQAGTEDSDTARNVDWARRYQKFLSQYDNVTDTRVCTGSEPMTDSGEACRFFVKDLGPCGVYPYGYELAKDQSEPQGRKEGRKEGALVLS